MDTTEPHEMVGEFHCDVCKGTAQNPLHGTEPHHRGLSAWDSIVDSTSYSTLATIAALSHQEAPERCGATMHSGLTCALAPDHDGEHVDRLGLRDPSWVRER